VSDSPTPIHIVGTGAMACLWGSYFLSSQPLIFINRHQQNASFEYSVAPSNQQIQAITRSTENSGEITQLIIACKAFDALSAVEMLKPHLHPEADLVLLQNGMGSQQDIAEVFKSYAVYACSSTEGAYKADSQTLIHAGKGENHIGPLTQVAKSKGPMPWLPSTVFQWHQNIEPILWRKLLINCAINPLTALYQCQNGELLNNPSYYSHLQSTCMELDLLADYLRLKLDTALNLATQVCKVTSNNRSSMLQDYERSRRTELDFILGYAIKQCQKYNISCFELEALYSKLVQQGLKT